MGNNPGVAFFRLTAQHAKRFGPIAIGCFALALGAGFPLDASAQSASNGATLWNNYGCSGCHGLPPNVPQRNAADTPAVIDYAIANNYGGAMGGLAFVVAGERSDLAAYIGSVVPAISQATAINTPAIVGVDSHVLLGTGTFTSVAVVSGPGNGTTGPFVGTNVTYTPNPGFSGPDSFTYRATGPAGNSSTRTVSITVGSGTQAGAAVMTVPLNTPTTVDLAAFITGSSITGVVVVAPPARGTVAVNGTRVTYTPANNYFGPDAFTYSAFGSAGISPAALVSVSVAGRPDPSRDATVVGVLAAQADAARRFATAQISNFHRRLESLHRRGGSTPTVSAGSDAQANRPATTGPVAPVMVAEGGAEMNLLPLANGAFSLLTTRSVNLAGLAPRGGAGPDTPAGAPGGVNFWLDGTANLGTRSATGSRSGLDFSTSGVSAGADRRFSEQWAMGIGFGYAQDRTQIGIDGSSSRARGFSVAAYGSYQPTPKTFVDGLIGAGSLEFDTQRFVAPANDFARANRNGYQAFGSLAAGYEHRADGVLVSPYARLDYSADRLKQSTETGAGPYALTYFSQTAPTVQGALGVRGESVHATSFGWAIPRVRAEYRREFQGERLASVAYADSIGGPRYALSTGAIARNSLALGIGSDFVTRDGLTFGVDFQQTYASSQDSNYAIRVRVSKDFDGRGSASSLRSDSSSVGKPLDIQIDAGYVFDDNVTRGKDSAEKLSDRSYSVNLNKTWVFPITEHTRTLLTGSLGGEKFQNYNGLSRVSGGVQGQFQYRGSAEFSAATYAVFARAFADYYESDLRGGQRYSAGISVAQPLTDRIRLFGALTHNERNAASDVFNIRDNSARLNADYALSPAGTVYLGGEVRRGDAVSTGRASLASLDVARASGRDDAFPGQLFSYRFDARTVLTTLGYNLGFGPRDSLDFSWRRIEATPVLRVSFDTSAQSYISNQYSIVYLLRF